MSCLGRSTKDVDSPHVHAMLITTMN